MDAGAFTPAAAAALAGEDWQRERRIAAAERLATLSLPSAAEEDWRYSRIDELDLSLYGPVAPEQARAAAATLRIDLSAGLVGALEAAGPIAGRVRTVDGAAVGEAGADRATAGEGSERGERGERGEAGPGGEPGELGEGEPSDLGALVAPHSDAFLALSDAFAGDLVVVDLAAGEEPDGPIVISHDFLLTEGDGGRLPAVFPRTLLRLGEGARATVVEVLSSGPGRRLVVPVTEVVLGDGARLELYSIQQLGPEAWHIGYQASRLGREAALTSFVAGLGGDYARQLTRSTLQGEAGSSRLLSVYLGDDRQMQDIRTFQEHVAPRTKSELVFKGAVSGTAQSVYTGVIAMRKGARRADASQTNRNLVLSEGAYAHSVPNLDIEENDVRCSHASAVGPIDPELVFYLESRGVAPEAARRLVLLGFFEDLLAGLGLGAVAAH
ncbi:MAG TPA: SufD family Fe-S cluster assembly protein, partial [Acidimicrobiales bacterium]|nr:SufD family Fe-S cluster assembly protein [Acidimicrobiales bacterium]